ncbi:putative uncharacterized protein DDB_G0290521 isoform X1 [Aethina tumida]|uniref:putative uncharacterized protein DDB_G0290521 isoform X1 n=1 Tax=Aethina tumida TaxID=116153 RepID=UPI00096B4C22|nr:putative uncharacterized protein DDB_G0290521 isoform X1 [Aethina tumida]
MPEYQPLNGEGSIRGNWSSLTRLEKRLIFLTVFLGITIFGLAIVLTTHTCSRPPKPIPPTPNPTEPTERPTDKPTEIPTSTNKPTEKSTQTPTEKPTEKPTQIPTEKPTEKPTQIPTEKPTEKPTQISSEKPTQTPTEKPTQTPTEKPSVKPTVISTETPTQKPTNQVVKNGGTESPIEYQTYLSMLDNTTGSDDNHKLSESEVKTTEESIIKIMESSNYFN